MTKKGLRRKRFFLFFILLHVVVSNVFRVVSQNSGIESSRVVESSCWSRRLVEKSRVVLVESSRVVLMELSWWSKVELCWSVKSSRVVLLELSWWSKVELC